MKQLIQNYRNGSIEIIDTPPPPIKDGHLLIATRCSVISAGTERTITQFAGSNLISKIKQRPEKLRTAIQQVKDEGVQRTFKSVQEKLDRWYPLGYCNAGIILEAGLNTDGFKPGMRVACNGNHSEIVLVPKNLCSVIPESVSDETAAFAILGAIALQGVRLAKPTLGEYFAVIGLGLVGLITVQLLHANGCKVLAIEPNEERARLGREFGAQVLANDDTTSILSSAQQFTAGNGIDGVLITAATDSEKPIEYSARICRKRGRIVLTGVTGLNINRSDFYEKEISFQISCSYGPGRYDKQYEDNGNDYPIGFVRWTEQRNISAILDLMNSGSIQISPLISHQFAFDLAQQAYDVLVNDTSSLGILLNYKPKVKKEEILYPKSIVITPDNRKRASDKPNIALIGPGNYAIHSLLPALQESSIRLHTLMSNGQPHSVKLAKKYGFKRYTTDYDEILDNESINCVVIATRHDSHAALTVRALNAGKSVYVEKPIAITREELSEVEKAYKNNMNNSMLMIGYNRRFSPLLQKIKKLLKEITNPKSLIYTINSGSVPDNHWTTDKRIGGGRIIGEVCHFIDLACWIINSDIVSVSTVPAESISCGIDDGIMTTILFANGSVAAIHYLTNGSNKLSKERLEIHTAGKSILLDNFKQVIGYGWQGFSSYKLKFQDKGNAECIKLFMQNLSRGEPSPICFNDIIQSMKITFDIDEQRVIGKIDDILIQDK